MLTRQTSTLSVEISNYDFYKVKAIYHSSLLGEVVSSKLEAAGNGGVTRLQEVVRVLLHLDAGEPLLHTLVLQRTHHLTTPRGRRLDSSSRLRLRPVIMISHIIYRTSADSEGLLTATAQRTAEEGGDRDITFLPT